MMFQEQIEIERTRVNFFYAVAAMKQTSVFITYCCLDNTELLPT